jgi:cytochrome P450
MDLNEIRNVVQGAKTLAVLGKEVFKRYGSGMQSLAMIALISTSARTDTLVDIRTATQDTVDITGKDRPKAETLSVSATSRYICEMFGVDFEDTTDKLNAIFTDQLHIFKNTSEQDRKYTDEYARTMSVLSLMSQLERDISVAGLYDDDDIDEDGLKAFIEMLRANRGK